MVLVIGGGIGTGLRCYGVRGFYWRCAEDDAVPYCHHDGGELILNNIRQAGPCDQKQLSISFVHSGSYMDFNHTCSYLLLALVS